MGLPYFIALLGEALAAAGDVAGGLAELDRALEIARGNGARFQISELLRLKAELLLREPSNDPGVAEGLLREAVTAAHEQGARLPELRASTSLARMLASDPVAMGSERRHVSVLYAGFTEGQATPDLADARRLLELGGAAPRPPIAGSGQANASAQATGTGVRPARGHNTGPIPSSTKNQSRD
jgi:predicted ATPase